jgi:predicted enzyme related to lactoylglutathione lyase
MTPEAGACARPATRSPDTVAATSLESGSRSAFRFRRYTLVVATLERSRGTDQSPVVLVEFPADDPERARAFWSRVLAVELEPREDVEGHGWQTHGDGPALGVHERGPGPGDRFSLVYFAVDDLEAALDRVRSAGGDVVHPGERWAVCRDSEGSPFGLAQRTQG